MTENQIVETIKRVGRPVKFNKFKNKEFKRKYQIELYHKTEPIQCTCGKYVHPFKLARHKRSVYHKKYSNEIVNEY